MNIHTERVLTRVVAATAFVVLVIYGHNDAAAVVVVGWAYWEH